MLRRIYNWCIDAAHKPYALWIMGAVSFAESSFFPVPPDVMLIPMSLARPERAWLYAAVCTATSVLGGLLGYAIGALLYDSIGHWLIEFYGLGGKVEAFRASYAEWGALIIIGKGLTPIPYKLVTITSGCSWCARSWLAADVSSWSRSCSTATANGSGSGSRSIWGCGWRWAPLYWCWVLLSQSE